MDWSVDERDAKAVRDALGRRPRGDYVVAARDTSGTPTVLRNAPFLRDGTPMPTLYWLCGREQIAAIGRLESDGGVREAEAVIDAQRIAAAHQRYAAERDALIPSGHQGPRPVGGVGGTRQGLKCLHAHYAYFLAGGQDPVGLWVDQQLHAKKSGVLLREERIAAIDCGSNSTRLLIATPTQKLFGALSYTHLGTGVDASGRLSEGPMSATLDCFREFDSMCEVFGVDVRRAIATSAVRDAENSAVFLKEATAILGTPLEVVSGDTEGRFTFQGATANLSGRDQVCLVIDIGGGSTELILGMPGEAQLGESHQIGAVRLTEQALHHDPYLPSEVTRAREIARSVFESSEVLRNAAAQSDLMFIGVAGTVTSLAGAKLEVAVYDPYRTHGTVITRKYVTDMIERLATQALSERKREIAPIAERAEVIVAGAIVLEAAMLQLGLKSVCVSEEDLLLGMIHASKTTTARRYD